jgi:AraC family transcriptional regulator
MVRVYESQLGRTTITAELHVPAAAVQLLTFDFVDTDYHHLREEAAYRLDLSLNARLQGSALQFEEHWATHRYEKPGRLFLLPPGETARIRSGVGHQDAIVCHLPLGRVKAWLDDDIRWTERRLEASLDISSNTVCSLLIRLGEEARHPGFATEVLSEALAVQIAVTLERYFRDLPEASPAGGLSVRRLGLIDERIRDCASAPSLSELAALCGLSVRQLTRGFRVSRGVPLGNYVAQWRIETAKDLIRDGESVKAVAYRMGFGSPSSFSFAFRKAVGLSPKAFRDCQDRSDCLPS